MRRIVTSALFMTLLVLSAESVWAQNCNPGNTAMATIRAINALDQTSADAMLAEGANLTQERVNELLPNALWNTCVQFSAVLLTDPLSSGLGNVSNDRPSRLHVFVRDTSANSQGVDGMTLQLVDGAYETTGLKNATVGDVVTVVGVVSPFAGSRGVSMQVSPESITLEGSFSDFGLPDSITDPVVITTADANRDISGDGRVQVNWANMSNLNGQFVRLEGAVVTRRDVASSPDRPNWLISSDGGTTVVNFYDMSLRYRNDRSNYPDEFNKRDDRDDFIPPPPGSKINMQGFLVFQGDDPFAVGNPEFMLLSLVPFADSDLEILETPPVLTGLSKPDFIPGATPIDITFTVAADPLRTITSASVHYKFSDATDTVTLPATDNGGGSFSAQIPAAADGVFVTYSASATDNTGATSQTSDRSYRVLTNGISSISHIQETADGGPGDSPFTGLTTDMNITATVQSDPDVSGFVVVQDDTGFAPWSGLLIRDTDAIVADLNPGDVINITNAEIEERFGVTRLDNVTYTKTGSGSTLGYKVVTTAALSDPNIAEAHEGMMVRIENAVITDADAGFGEWSFSDDGSTDIEVNGDDSSDDIGSSFNTDTFVDGGRYAFIQGIWWFSFGSYKILPETAADVGAITNTTVEDDVLPGRFALRQNYPNPFNPVTRMEYQIPAATQVTLEVTDVLGRRVAMLVNENQLPGSYQVTFDGSGLASGLYLYRLTAGTETMTRTMVLLK